MGAIDRRKRVAHDRRRGYAERGYCPRFLPFQFFDHTGSSLTSRGMFSYEDAQADAVKRKDTERYEQLRKERYIRGVQEEQPAVMALNMSIAPLGVMELFARLYRFRDDPNSRYATTTLSLTQMGLYAEPEGAPCPVLRRVTGRGDMSPLLDLPELSA
jgi:hypothetical protein